MTVSRETCIILYPCCTLYSTVPLQLHTYFYSGHGHGNVWFSSTVSDFKGNKDRIKEITFFIYFFSMRVGTELETFDVYKWLIFCKYNCYTSMFCLVYNVHIYITLYMYLNILVLIDNCILHIWAYLNKWTWKCRIMLILSSDIIESHQLINQISFN